MKVSDTAYLSCEYFPTISWIAHYLKSTHVLLEVHDYFPRKSYRNRAKITGPNGELLLSVPLKGGRNQRTITKDIEIANHIKWQHQHLRTLDACYRSSPYFEYYMPYFEKIFTHQYRFIHDMHLDILQAILAILKVTPMHKVTEKYLSSTQSDDLIDYRNEYPILSSTTYLQPFLDRHGFVPNLSVIDLLFCAGTQSKEIIINAQ